jgi:galactoside O-acetyltransferase
MANPFDPGYYTEHDLRDVGFASLGSNVRIARNTTIIGPEHVSLGSDVRIDGGTVIAAASGTLSIGNFVHIAGSCHLICGGGVALEDFAGISHGVRIFSASDDYSGASLTNPLVPKKYLNVRVAPVTLRRHVIVGAGTVILPGVDIGLGSAVGALSLVSKSLEEWGVYSGIPARRIKDRSRRLLELEAELLRERGIGG